MTAMKKKKKKMIFMMIEVSSFLRNYIQMPWKAKWTNHFETFGFPIEIYSIRQALMMFILYNKHK